MSNRTRREGAQEPETTPTELERIATRVEWLTSELKRLSQSIETEVRTRRLVIVDPSGAERVVAEATTRRASIRVDRQHREHPAASYAELYAGDEEDGVGVLLSALGDCAIHMGTTEDRDKGWFRGWIDLEDRNTWPDHGAYGPSYSINASGPSYRS